MEALQTKVIGIVNQKGGAGKTTLTVLTANSIAVNFNKKIAIIDADIQGSIIAKRKLEMEEGITEFPYQVIYSRPSDLMNQLEQMDGSFDYIFIDMPGQAYGEGLSELLLSLDYAFVPCTDGDTDVSSTYDFLKILTEVKSLKKEKLDMDMRIHLINNKAGSTLRYKDMIQFYNQLIGDLRSIEMRDDNLQLRNKVAYQNLFSTYQSGYGKGDGNFDNYIQSFLEKIQN